jgi:hypothetical protein
MRRAAQQALDMLLAVRHGDLTQPHDPTRASRL